MEEVVVGKLKDVIKKVFRDYDQPDNVAKEFLAFYENLILDNTGDHDLEDLIESIKLLEESSSDGSENPQT
jgi:hypothetical protein